MCVFKCLCMFVVCVDGLPQWHAAFLEYLLECLKLIEVGNQPALNGLYYQFQSMNELDRSASDSAGAAIDEVTHKQTRVHHSFFAVLY